MTLRKKYPTAQDFFERVSDFSSDLESSSVDYRIIGSLGYAANMQASDMPYEGIKIVRPGAVTRDQSVPDIDLIAPRADMPRLRELRTEYGAHAHVPIKIGIAAIAQTYDFRPEHTESYLTHKYLRQAVPTDLLEAQQVSLGGVDFASFKPTALAYTYETVGGVQRAKDAVRREDLISLPSDERLEDFRCFEEFWQKRRTRYPGYIAASKLYSQVDQYMPRRIGNVIKSAALPVADLLKLR